MAEIADFKMSGNHYGNNNYNELLINQYNKISIKLLILFFTHEFKFKILNYTLFNSQSENCKKKLN